MSVTVAKGAGFCFGVRRATEAVEAAIANRVQGEVIVTLGRLIHNNDYLSGLEATGVRTVSEEDIPELCRFADAAHPVRLFVRAHGMTAATERMLLRCAEENPYFHFTDCTCPYVSKIHRIVVEQTNADHPLFILGSANHPEVQGIVSRAKGQFWVFDSVNALSALFDVEIKKQTTSKVPIVVAQTTQKLEEWTKTKKFLKNHYTNAIIFDTICSVTDSRQREAAILSQASDFMIVIGGRDSSNSAKLYSVCQSYCADTVWIENAAQLRIPVPFAHQRVGITAGASTPRCIIEEVKETMSEIMENDNFEAMLEKSLKTLNTGDTVTGYVTAISAGEIQLDLGAKVTGRIEFDQITDDPSAKLSDMFKIGDPVEAFVIRVSDLDGMATLSKKRVDSDKNWKNVEAAKESGEVLEGRVVEAVKSGVIVSVGGVRVFVHESQTGAPKDTDLHTLVGKTVRLKITDIRDGKKARGSVRQVLRDERRALEDAFWANIEEGKYYTGVVKSMTSYGAFVDLGGVDGMVHASELSWKHIKSPAEILSIGDEITVFVKSFDKEKKRISLGYKTEETNPWYIFTHTYAVGDVAPVKIVSMMPFGAFAEIIEGVDGLIHISEIADYRIAKPADVLEIGQVVDAKILDIDSEKQKVALSIRALLEDAKAQEEAAEAEAADESAE